MFLNAYFRLCPFGLRGRVYEKLNNPIHDLPEHVAALQHLPQHKNFSTRLLRMTGKPDLFIFHVIVSDRETIVGADNPSGH